MADSKITALGSIGTGTDPANDQLVIVDVSDVLPTGMATTGTTKRVGLNQLLSSSPTATGAFSVTGLVTAGSATITGALTVDTNTLKVDSTNHRVGIVNASPAYPLDVTGIIHSTQDVYAIGGRLALYRSSGASYFDWSTSQDLVWRQVTSVGGAGASTLMTLNSTGLGVGVSPSYKLHVAGRISYTGTIGEGADATLSSSGTALLHGNAAAWTSQTFYTGGTSRAVIKQNGQVRFVPLAADPASPEAGDVYYNSTSNKLKCYNGTTWNDLF